MANKTINQLTAVATVTNADEVEVQKSGETTTKKATVDRLTEVERLARIAQDNTIEAGVGLNADGTYLSLTNSWYIRAAEFLAGVTDRGGATGALTESVENALRILDAAIYNTTIYAYTSQFMQTATVVCSSADILACNAVPKILLPAVPGYYYEVISVVGYNNFNSAAFEAGTDKLEIKYNGGAIMFEFSNAFLESASDVYHRALPTTGTVITTGSNVQMYCATAPTTGDGAITVKLTYRLHAV